MTERPEPLRLVFSADELAVLARAIGVAERLGPAEPAQDHLRQQQLLANGADGRVQLDYLVGGLLGMCAFPSFSPTITRRASTVQTAGASTTAARWPSSGAAWRMGNKH